MQSTLRLFCDMSQVKVWVIDTSYHAIAECNCILNCDCPIIGIQQYIFMNFFAYNDNFFSKKVKYAQLDYNSCIWKQSNVALL